MVCLVCHHVPSASNMPATENEVSVNICSMTDGVKMPGGGHGVSDCSHSLPALGSYLFLIRKLEVGEKTPPSATTPRGHPRRGGPSA